MHRARDTKLGRDVALKVLPELFALDADRLARFRREAQVLAKLNHPNIAAIHGLEESNPSAGSGQAAVLALVLELVEGPTLAEVIAGGTAESARFPQASAPSESEAWQAVFSAARDGGENIYWQAADGSGAAEPLTKTSDDSSRTHSRPRPGGSSSPDRRYRLIVAS